MTKKTYPKQIPEENSLLGQMGADKLLPSLIRSQPTFMLLLGFTMILIASLWFLLDVWLVVFASVLVCIFILSLVELLHKIPFIGGWFAKKPHGLSVLTVVTLLTGVLAGLGVMFGNELIAQLGAMKESLPFALQKLKGYSDTLPIIGQWIENQGVFDHEKGQALSTVMQKISDSITLTPEVVNQLLGGFTTFLAIILVGVFFAMSPHSYARGFIRLIAPSYRDRGTYLLERSYIALQRWLVGQFVVMAFVGITTAVGLWLMDIPFAFALGFIAFVLDFVPVLGPWIAAVPLILVTLLFSPDMIVWVIILMFVIQQLESYVVAPVVQHKFVSLPPVALLMSQLVMATLTGFLGIALATPLIVLVIVWTQILYVKFVLGDYQIMVIGQTDGELKDDPFNALSYGKIYADNMKIQLVEGAKIEESQIEGNQIPCKTEQLTKIKDPTI